MLVKRRVFAAVTGVFLSAALGLAPALPTMIGATNK